MRFLNKVKKAILMVIEAWNYYETESAQYRCSHTYMIGNWQHYF